MNSAEQFIREKLKERTENASIRKLSADHLPIDFCSNDYLGFARSAALEKRIYASLKTQEHYQNGSGGSRLLSGNYAFTEKTERMIARFHEAEAGLIFNSGYDANLGLLSSLAQRRDTIISDELIHASLIDGSRLGHANRFRFRHNDLEDLEAKLKKASGIIYVVVESVYSMDGDIAPLKGLSSLCLKYNAQLIVDEAHATGVFGNHGNGLVCQETLQTQVFARIITFGKALGCHGAIVLGSNQLRNYLINFARSFIYTTAAPMHSITSVSCAYELLKEKDQTSAIREKIDYYARLLQNSGISQQAATPSSIQTIRCPGNETARTVARKLQNKGLDVRAILSPTVKAGEERLRICLHTYNTTAEISLLIQELSNLYPYA